MGRRRVFFGWRIGENKSLNREKKVQKLMDDMIADVAQQKHNKNNAMLQLLERERDIYIYIYIYRFHKICELLIGYPCM